jgi:hypothetical protein
MLHSLAAYSKLICSAETLVYLNLFSLLAQHPLPDLNLLTSLTTLYLQFQAKTANFSTGSRYLNINQNHDLLKVKVF